MTCLVVPLGRQQESDPTALGSARISAGRDTRRKITHEVAYNVESTMLRNR